VHNTFFLRERFFRLFGDCTELSGNYSEQAIEFTGAFLFGGAFTGLDPATLQYSNLIILWGLNIVDNRFGCEMESRIREARRKGVPVIVIDPRRNRTVTRLDTSWIPLQPGTDSVLMAAVLHVLLEKGLVDYAAVRKLSEGFEGIEAYICGEHDGNAKTPEWAEKICGTPASQIREFAALYGKTKPAALLPGLSIQRTMGGEEAVRLAAALQVATGNVGIRGGSTGGNVLNKLPQPRCETIRLKRSFHGHSIPVSRWPDAVVGGRGAGFPCDIQLIYTIGCNFLSQGSDIQKNIQAFQKVRFSVCHDYFLTPTARYSDVVLPVSTFLERPDVIFPRSNHLFYSHKVIEPMEDVRNDYDILCELADRLGFLEEFSEDRSADQWIAHVLAGSEVHDIDSFLETGIHTGEEQQRTGLSDFAADPVTNPLNTPSGKIQLDFSPYGEIGFAPCPECRVLMQTDSFPLRLITPHARYRTHSQYHNIPWFRERQDRSLWIHPTDAKRRAISDGMEVLVVSDRGRMKIHARVTEDITPGVVSAHQGVWPEFDSDGTETQGSVNILTPTDPTEPSLGSRTHSVLVEVTPF
jgi:anaerobic dimethyl sulfoxide reductase subunit A